MDAFKFLAKSFLLRRYCSTVEKYEYWNKTQHESWQFTRLKQLLTQAELYVPYYRRTFQEIGFSAEDFREIRDIEKLPFTT